MTLRPHRLSGATTATGAALAAVGFAASEAVGTAGARTVEDCAWRADMRFFTEPRKTSSRTFANGEPRPVPIDTCDPAARPVRILAISPSRGPGGWRQCKAIGGFSDRMLDFALKRASGAAAAFVGPVDE